FQKPEMPVFSNTTAQPYPKTSKGIRELLSRHITEPLQFVPQIQNLYEAGVHIFVEAGPGRTLTTLVSKILANKPHAALCLDVPGRSGWSQLAALLAEAHNLQLPINLEPWFRGRRLQSMSTDDYLEKAEALANPPPHIWRVNGGRARPWHQKPTVKAEQKTTANRNGERPQDLQKSPSDAAPQTRQETSPTMSPNREHQTVEALNSKENGSPEPATNHNSESILGHVQNTMSQFFEMQREQQKVMNRFLDLQEQMLQLAMKNGDASLIKKSFRTSDHEGQAFGQTENRPLVPVLPKLKVKPAAPSVISPGPEQPGAKVTEPKGTSAPKTEASSLPAKSDDTNFEAVASTEEFKADLLATVCKRTGYPQDMLDLDAHLEGDLGLDSIKMVEIFSELREHHRVLQIQDQDRILEEVSTLNTLRGIIDWYDTNRINDEGNGAPTEQQASEAKTSIGDKSTTSGIEKKNRIQSRPEQTGTKEKDPALTSDPVRRFILKPEPAPLQPKSDSSTFPNDRLILVIGEAPQISAALHGALAAQNHRVRQIIPSKQTRALGDDRIEVDLSSEDSIHELRERLKTSGDTVGAIFNLLALIKDEATGSEDARGLFLLLKSFESDLKESARSGGGWIIHFTSMGGQFALKEATTQSFDQTGCIGLLKTVAREWQDVKVKCIDVDLNMEPHMLLAQTTQELLTQDDLIEVGLNSEGRWKIAVQPQPHSGQ
ncbi:hypothetical protein GWO43_02745, partial [candidate division KSB1 bacterium]|nr:hypothetical protein [candidate division KSB1 bacterium]NIR69851.1 hypothetical protein [candidate division KSB1 bacterium]NIS22971.1 hypothetical protein [candidate division KSB1 bacterium]NIT69828.1 hypothetical protein [candidate division KSB1 bacterium]NIU25750.1 hypothetical protein [candidate division KSB1 bacterium]